MIYEMRRLLGTGTALAALAFLGCSEEQTSRSSEQGTGGFVSAGAAGGSATGATAGKGTTGSGGTRPGSGGTTGGSTSTGDTGGRPASGGIAGATAGTPGVGGGTGQPRTGGAGGAEAGTAGVGATGGEAGNAGSEEGTELRSTVEHETTPEISEADYRTFISGTNDFGLSMFQELVGEQNLVFSPVSTAAALAMTYAGARGDTATQMATVLHNRLEAEVFHAAHNRLALDLAARNIAPHPTQDGDKSVRLALVNGVWAQRDYEILPGYLDLLSANYDAGVRILDFVGNPDGSRLVINQWVADQTEDRIRDLIPPRGIDTDTRLVLTNALYFYGTWEAPFLPQSTSDGPFHTLGGAQVTVPMLHALRHYPYATGPGYQMLDLPYDGGQLALTILLPDAGRFEDIRDSLNDEWLTEARAGINNDHEIRLSLPKFRFTWGTQSLKPALQSLGMTDAFVYPIADFTGIEPKRELYVSDVFHQAFIGVDEHGTEAAAATAVVMVAGAIPDPIEVSVDRPFLFFIRDTTGLLLFVGQVVDPSAS